MSPFCAVCDAGLALLCCRWHPRCDIGLPVLPLCGAALTFFAAAKKVSKESGLTPPILDLYPRAPNVPVFLAATRWRAALPSLPTSHHPLQASVQRQTMSKLPRPICGKRCVGFRAAKHSDLAKNHSMPIPLRCDNLHTVCRKWALNVPYLWPSHESMEWVRRLFEALATNTGQRTCA